MLVTQFVLLFVCWHAAAYSGVLSLEVCHTNCFLLLKKEVTAVLSFKIALILCFMVFLLHFPVLVVTRANPSLKSLSGLIECHAHKNVL